jgi:hypothetical protein
VRSQRVYVRGFSHVICHGGEGILSPGISGQTVLRETPPTARARKAGRASVWRLARIPCMGSRNRISVRVFTLTAERGSLSWQCVYGISPIGGGADGEGERNFPPPLSPMSPVERYS